MITHIKYAGIPVSDYDRALIFYKEKLGFRLLNDQRFTDGSRWIELEIPSAQTKAVLFTPPGQENRIGTLSHITFTSDDVWKSYEDMTNRGVEFSQPPKETPWGIYAQFIDSEGNKFILSS